MPLNKTRAQTPNNFAAVAANALPNLNDSQANIQLAQLSSTIAADINSATLTDGSYAPTAQETTDLLRLVGRANTATEVKTLASQYGYPIPKANTYTGSVAEVLATHVGQHAMALKNGSVAPSFVPDTSVTFSDAIQNVAAWAGDPENPDLRNSASQSVARAANARGFSAFTSQNLKKAAQIIRTNKPTADANLPVM